ncbi:hypothetical protein O9G_000293 [Rozella allomycis CSF55]|uniref:Uncharacterized protein n=1 Tax=Rozella allomycis (strain CSF55) TaxID=988480 RepID=A0A075AP58_ROZAC|nr:hypothetical protein O9G_000293 [Rozella allomycis CSF55]|eukprot:EPZ31814.1 hypothetical protein O9G_000293 [Rozella allomycis CSF55]
MLTFKPPEDLPKRRSAKSADSTNFLNEQVAITNKEETNKKESSRRKKPTKAKESPKNNNKENTNQKKLKKEPKSDTKNKILTETSNNGEKDISNENVKVVNDISTIKEEVMETKNNEPEKSEEWPELESVESNIDWKKKYEDLLYKRTTKLEKALQDQMKAFQERDRHLKRLVEALQLEMKNMETTYTQEIEIWKEKFKSASKMNNEINKSISVMQQKITGLNVLNTKEEQDEEFGTVFLYKCVFNCPQGKFSLKQFPSERWIDYIPETIALVGDAGVFKNSIGFEESELFAFFARLVLLSHQLE